MCYIFDNWKAYQHRSNSKLQCYGIRYGSIINKTLAIFQDGAGVGAGVVIKVDDDSFVNVPGVRAELALRCRQGCWGSRIYAGCLRLRAKVSRPPSPPSPRAYTHAHAHTPPSAQLSLTRFLLVPSGFCETLHCRQILQIARDGYRDSDLIMRRSVHHLHCSLVLMWKGVLGAPQCFGAVARRRLPEPYRASSSKPLFRNRCKHYGTSVTSFNSKGLRTHDKAA